MNIYRVRKIFITILFSAIKFNATAQINESDTLKFQLRTSLTGNYQKGNVEVLNLRSKIDFSYSPHSNWVFKSQNSSLYQAFYSRKADNDVFSRNYLYYKSHLRIYPFAIAYISSNFRRKIDSRYFAGVGATWQIFNVNKNVLKFSLSAINESTNFKNDRYNYKDYNGRDRINLGRFTLYMGGWTYLPERRVRLFYDAFYQLAFNNKNNFRTQADAGMEFPIWKGLSFNALFTYTHENVVIEGIKQDDSILTFGLSYSFKVK